MSHEPIVITPNGRHGDRPATTTPVAAVGTNLASLLIPCCGMLEYTKLCVPALLKHTRPPFELLFLDVGSLDGTAEYLHGLAAAAPCRVAVFRAATDLDLPGAITDALEAARGESLVLLNNDTVVSDGWLQQLLAWRRCRRRWGWSGR